ncbi:MAG: UDP-N-acetylmuramoyl-L-alanyl-D-glutamate--2,6-diaminopimelate ligase [Betaproteobacteria bacterium]|nr:UDP-N-acetylmuramoyl-L-alanyl-D-glutamate--2,6-diaminopimelate ligase [Betaproteobacteria bacterium]
MGTERDAVNAEAAQVLQQLAAQGVRAGGLATDSRALRPDEVFLAMPGARSDGRQHIDAALAAGASAVLWEREGWEWDAAARHGVPNLPVAGLRGLAGHLAHEVYGRPSEKLWTMGVTGTNGKTSCSQWLAHTCTDCGARTAVIGTLGSGFPGALDASRFGAVINTTPDPVLLHRALAELHAAGAQGVAMEVSSIGLDQERTNGVVFGAALFTNLSRDHLDYHGDMESYARAKQRLFQSPGLRHAIVNLDDVQGVQIGRMLSGSGVNRAGYSCFEGVAMRAGLESWVEAHGTDLSARGMSFTVRSSWGEARLKTPLLGRFNLSNLLGVLATMLVSGVPFERATAALEHLQPVAGRMQRFGGGTQPLAVVDYAHTPDALEKTLAALKDVARASGGRLVCLFGCGGERDRGKRALMGAIAARHADRVVLTSDNPRGEDPLLILDDILAGMGEGQSAAPLVDPDRAAAIRAAILAAATSDVVLIAGKGHEDYQEVAGVKRPFSDALEAQAALRDWKA